MCRFPILAVLYKSYLVGVADLRRGVGGLRRGVGGLMGFCNVPRIIGGGWGGLWVLGECTDYRRRAIGMHTPTKPPHGGALGPCAYGAIYKHDFFFEIQDCITAK